MNKPEKIINLVAHDFSGNPGAVITKSNTYTFDQYEPNHISWLRREDNVRGSLKIDQNAKNATFSPAFFA